MENLAHKIELYVGRKVNFNPMNGEVKLSDEGDGNGPQIVYWNVSGKSQPTTSQLNALESQAKTVNDNVKVARVRRRAYDSITDQLDMLYKDLVAGKLDATGEWAKMVKKVKDDNPKE
jgi:hypothetical protein